MRGLILTRLTSTGVRGRRRRLALRGLSWTGGSVRDFLRGVRFTVRASSASDAVGFLLVGVEASWKKLTYYYPEGQNFRYTANQAVTEFDGRVKSII